MADHTQTFTLAAAGIHLPLSLDPEEPGNVVDATGTHVLQIDINRDRPDASTIAIALAIVSAVNNAAESAVVVGDHFDAMAESFRLQTLDIAIRAHAASGYRNLGTQDQMLCIMAGIVHGLLNICFASIQPAGRDAMLQAIADYLPIARQNVEETEAKTHG